MIKNPFFNLLQIYFLPAKVGVYKGAFFSDKTT